MTLKTTYYENSRAISARIRKRSNANRKVFKRIPEDKLTWKPLDKSMSLLELGNHLAEIPSWITATMEMEEMNMDGYEPTRLKSVDELIATLNKNASEAQESLKKEDSEYLKNWKMIVGGETGMEMPRINVLRSLVLNQLPHHRAQMGVFQIIGYPCAGHLWSFS